MKIKRLLTCTLFLGALCTTASLTTLSSCSSDSTTPDVADGYWSTWVSYKLGFQANAPGDAHFIHASPIDNDKSEGVFHLRYTAENGTRYLFKGKYQPVSGYIRQNEIRYRFQILDYCKKWEEGDAQPTDVPQNTIGNKLFIVNFENIDGLGDNTANPRIIQQWDLPGFTQPIDGPEYTFHAYVPQNDTP